MLTKKQWKRYLESDLPKVGWTVLQERKQSLDFDFVSLRCCVYCPETMDCALEQEEGREMGTNDSGAATRVPDGQGAARD